MAWVSPASVSSEPKFSLFFLAGSLPLHPSSASFVDPLKTSCSAKDASHIGAAMACGDHTKQSKVNVSLPLEFKTKSVVVDPVQLAGGAGAGGGPGGGAAAPARPGGG